jgi:hypothetical protein
VYVVNVILYDVCMFVNVMLYVLGVVLVAVFDVFEVLEEKNGAKPRIT